jgi:hypothetical protein
MLSLRTDNGREMSVGWNIEPTRKQPDSPGRLILKRLRFDGCIRLEQ